MAGSNPRKRFPCRLRFFLARDVYPRKVNAVCS
jgi:hypothetical protein